MTLTLQIFFYLFCSQVLSQQTKPTRNEEFPCEKLSNMNLNIITGFEFKGDVYLFGSVKSTAKPTPPSTLKPINKLNALPNPQPIPGAVLGRGNPAEIIPDNSEEEESTEQNNGPSGLLNREANRAKRAPIYPGGEGSTFIWLSRLRWNKRRRRFIPYPGYPKSQDKWTKEDITGQKLIIEENTIAFVKDDLFLYKKKGGVEQIGQTESFKFNATTSLFEANKATTNMPLLQKGTNNAIQWERILSLFQSNFNQTSQWSFFRGILENKPSAQPQKTKYIQVYNYFWGTSSDSWDVNIKEDIIGPWTEFAMRQLDPLRDTQRSFGYEFRQGLSFPVFYTAKMAVGKSSDPKRIPLNFLTATSIDSTASFYEQPRYPQEAFIIPLRTWFGCPFIEDQNCLDFFVDAVVPMKGAPATYLFFMGKNIYQVEQKNSHLKKETRGIGGVFVKGAKALETPTYVDTAFTNGTFYYILKNGRFYVYSSDEDKYKLKFYPSLNELIPESGEIQTAFTIDTQNGEPIYVFHDGDKSGMVSKYNKSKDVYEWDSAEKTTNINKDNPEYLDAVFLMGNEVFFIIGPYIAYMQKEDFYEKQGHAKYEHLAISGLFGCTVTQEERMKLYAKSATPAAFKGKYKEITKPTTTVETTQPGVTESVPRESETSTASSEESKTSSIASDSTSGYTTDKSTIISSSGDSSKNSTDDDFDEEVDQASTSKEISKTSGIIIVLLSAAVFGLSFIVSSVVVFLLIRCVNGPKETM